MSCEKCENTKLAPANQKNTVYLRCSECDRPLNEVEDKKRTIQQNKAMWKFCEELSNELNKRGLDMKVVLKPSVDIMWDKNTVMEYLWRPIQLAVLQKESTTELEKHEVDKVFQFIQHHLGEKFGLELTFPSDEIQRR